MTLLPIFHALLHFYYCSYIYCANLCNIILSLLRSEQYIHYLFIHHNLPALVLGFTMNVGNTTWMWSTVYVSVFFYVIHMKCYLLFCRHLAQILT